jgi:DNA modification methylase
MKTKTVDVAEPLFKKFRMKDLNPAEYNPRVISDEALEGLTVSLMMFGCVEPIIVNVRDDRNVIVGGHQRYKVIMKMYGGDCVRTCVVVDLSVSEEKTLNVALNNPHTQGGFIDNLSAYIEQLRLEIPEQDYLDLQIDKLRGEIEAVEGLTDPDDVPEPPKVAVTKLGDLYLLGAHRLLCGDSTKPDEVERLMDKVKADMVFCDPPWNVNYGAVEKGNAQGYKPRTILNDYMGTDDFREFMESAFARMNEASVPGAMTYVVMSAQEWGNMMLAMAINNYHWSSTIIWNKDRLVLSRKDYHTKYEPLWYGWKDGEARVCPLDDRKQSDVWDIPRPSSSELHPTTKPVELVERALLNSSRPGNTILDLFLGSGTTMIACEKTGRKCYGMELDPIYCVRLMYRIAA